MATSLANPQSSGSAPQPGGAPDPTQQQANPLQEMLGRLIIALRQLGTQNEIIQPELQQMASIAIQALQKVSQATAGPAQSPQAPPNA
jgi:hypothetical protein